MASVVHLHTDADIQTVIITLPMLRGRSNMSLASTNLCVMQRSVAVPDKELPQRFLSIPSSQPWLLGDFP